VPLLVIACYKPATLDSSGDGAIDAPAIDASPPDAAFFDAPFVLDAPGVMCFGTYRSYATAMMGICVTPRIGDHPLSATVDTIEGSSDCEPSNHPELCVVTGAMVTVSSHVTVTGDRPLVLIATASVTVTGTLDAASHGGSGGPGANPVDCTGTGADDGGTKCCAAAARAAAVVARSSARAASAAARST
jgi:hypothetical protein